MCTRVCVRVLGVVFVRVRVYKFTNQHIVTIKIQFSTINMSIHVQLRRSTATNSVHNTIILTDTHVDTPVLPCSTLGRRYRRPTSMYFRRRSNTRCHTCKSLLHRNCLVDERVSPCRLAVEVADRLYRQREETLDFTDNNAFQPSFHNIRSQMFRNSNVLTAFE